MKKLFITNAVLALTIVIGLNGCKKDKDEAASPSSTNTNLTTITSDTDASSVTDDAKADAAISEIFKSVSQAADTAAGAKAAACPTISITPLSGWPRTLTINFGTSGCYNKKGKIVAVMSAPFRTTGSTITVTTVKYSDGNDTIKLGTYTITNQGNNLAGNQYFTVDVSGTVITNPQGTITWNTNRTIEWIAGNTTPLNTQDDIYLVSGVASGTSVKGVSFTASISTPLRIDMSCSYIESGVISITPSGQATRVIDFGSGACDNDATVTIAGFTVNVKL